MYTPSSVPPLIIPHPLLPTCTHILHPPHTHHPIPFPLPSHHAHSPFTHTHMAHITHVSMAFVLIPGSFGLNLLYSSTSFSMESTSLCSLALSEGRVSLM